MQNDNSNAGLERGAGALNISLGAVLFIDGILLAIAALCCLLMSFSLFFMAAIPAFLVLGALCLLTFGSGIVNIITGVSAIVASKRSEKISFILSIVATVVDIAMIPANIVACAFGALMLYAEVSLLAVLILTVAVIAVILASVSLILSIVRITRSKAVSPSEGGAGSDGGI